MEFRETHRSSDTDTSASRAGWFVSKDTARPMTSAPMERDTFGPSRSSNKEHIVVIDDAFTSTKWSFKDRKDNGNAELGPTLGGIDQAISEVIVAPGPSETMNVRGNLGLREISTINAKDAQAVVIGDRNKLTVIYGATVQNSPISISDMVKAVRRTDSVLFRWVHVLFNSEDTLPSITSVSQSGFSTAAAHLNGIRVKGGTGVTVGDGNRVQAKVHFDVELTADHLAERPEIRDAVHQYLENPGNSDASVTLVSKLTEAQPCRDLVDLPNLPQPAVFQRGATLHVTDASTTIGKSNTVTTRRGPVKGGPRFKL